MIHLPTPEGLITISPDMDVKPITDTLGIQAQSEVEQRLMSSQLHQLSNLRMKRFSAQGVSVSLHFRVGHMARGAFRIL